MSTETTLPPMVGGSTSDLSPEQIAAFELLQLNAYYRAAHPAMRSLCWNLLQTTPGPSLRPVLLAFVLALDLLENEEQKAYHAAHPEEGEFDFPTQEEAIGAFWSGTLGNMEDSELVKQTPESERGAITRAALSLLALCPAKVSASAASKSRGALPEAIPAQKGAKP